MFSLRTDTFLAQCHVYVCMYDVYCVCVCVFVFEREIKHSGHNNNINSRDGIIQVYVSFNINSVWAFYFTNLSFLSYCCFTQCHTAINSIHFAKTYHHATTNIIT